MQTQNIRIFAILGAVTLLLLIPFIAMQFTTEVNWTGGDFLVAGLLLLAVGAGCELVFRKVHKGVPRIAWLALVLLTGLLLWAEMAVGIFGTPFAGS